METADLQATISALDHADEMTRLHAVYTLARGRDRRAVPHLIRVLGNHQETSSVRGQAAEGLGLLNKRKAIEALIEGSVDCSAEVRFWSVFALGHFVRRRKTPTAVVRALEARLDDHEAYKDYWAIRLEALAVLQGCRTTRVPLGEMFHETLLQVLRDPLNHPDQWQWASSYWHDSTAGATLFDTALGTISQAGSDPVTFGRMLNY
jgi:hypothetical protein